VSPATTPRAGTLQVAAPVVDIEDQPGGARQRQLLFGEPVQPLELSDAHMKVRALRDGYTGYVRRDLLSSPSTATHKVMALATHLYERPDMKSRDVASLSFGAKVTVLGEEGRFSRTREGLYVPTMHLVPAHRKFRDPAAVAELFLGTPYLWGGNSRLGLDCSGLVQAACIACGIACPGDTGDQSRQLGEPTPVTGGRRRGDLIFWEGHVGMLVSDTQMIHATAGFMSTVYEPLDDAIKRIRDQGDGHVTARRRLTLG
jgi:hypothetical protein